MDLALRTRKSSTKKRHTKPCKFFQTMQCPFSAEECDFAHIPKEDYPVQPSVHTKQCRYFVSGYCSQGIWCKFKHQVDGELEVADLQNDQTDSMCHSFDWDVRRQHIHIEQHDAPSYLAFPPLPFPPAYSSAKTSPPRIFPHVSRRPLPLTSPTYSSDSSILADIYSPTGSSSSVTDDDAVVFRDDLHASERTVPLRAPADEIAHTLLTCPPPSSVYLANLRLPDPAFYPIPQVTSPPPRSARSRSRSRPRQRLVTHKTKPCKFYRLNGVCPNGEQCTFIHDEKLEGGTAAKGAICPASEDSAQGQAEPTSGSNGSRKPQHDLPSKPLSLQEQNKKKGFFPIAWRVIGGGVMIGGKNRNISERDSYHKHDLDAPMPARTATPLTLSISLPTTAANLFISTPDPDQDAASPRPRTRTRALSNPSSPTSGRMDVLNLFSAESPGSL